METKLINISDFFDKVEKPLTPHITFGQEPITEVEVERRMQIADELESLGISISKFDAEDGHEDEDVLQAIIYANQGKKFQKILEKGLWQESYSSKDGVVPVFWVVYIVLCLCPSTLFQRSGVGRAHEPL